jgi:DNA-binding protein H-NS
LCGISKEVYDTNFENGNFSMTIDISKYSYKQLQELAVKTSEALAERRSEELKALTATFAKDLKDAAFEIKNGIEELRKHLPEAVKAAGGSRAAGPIRYRGPNGESWTGQGRTPKWIKNSGKPKTDFAV